MVDEPFGLALSALAAASKTIVDVGCWNGLGSTLCLFMGAQPGTRIIGVEADDGRASVARVVWRYQGNVEIIRGTVCKLEDFSPYFHPAPDHQKYYGPEYHLTATAGLVVDRMPEQIDLLVLDGGEWSGRGDFLSLWERSTCIAMDDTNPKRSVKNAYNREQLITSGWRVSADYQDQRNGWFIAHRP